MKRHYSIKAILIGGVTDILLTFVLFLSFTVAWGFVNLDELPMDQAIWEIKTAVRWNPSVYWPNFALACICSVIGGLVSAVIAKRDLVANSAAAAWASVASIFFFGFVPKMGGVASDLTWLHQISMVLHPILCALGGYILALWKKPTLR